MEMRKLGFVAAMLALQLACGVPGARSEGPEGSDGKSDRAALIVVHTGTSVLALSASAENRRRTRVEDYYPLVCLDSDDDADGMPDSMDPSPPATVGAGSAHDCERCNRGPGTNGDYRLDLQGGSVELDRGRVSEISMGVVTVLGPDGTLRIDLPATARIDDGPVTPGAEIRIEGSVVAANHFTAERVKVLCPGPGALPNELVPADATAIPAVADSGSPRDGGTVN